MAQSAMPPRPEPASHISMQSSTSSSVISASAPSTPATPDSPAPSWTSAHHRKSRTSSDGGSLRSHHRVHHGPLRQIRNALSSVPDTSSLGPSAISALARDVWAVASGIRKAHLVDKVHFSRSSLDELAHALVRVADEAHLPELRNIVISYEPVTQSTFVSNCFLIRQSAEETIDICTNKSSQEELTSWRDGRGAWMVYVSGERPQLLRKSEMGDCSARSTLFHLAKSLPAGPLPLSEDTLPIIDIPVSRYAPASGVPRAMVCIAGWLLSYPVIYVLDPRSGPIADDGDAEVDRNALAGQSLWIIKARLFGLKAGDDHLLFQCSMPESIFSFSEYTTPLSAGAMHDGTIPVSDVCDRIQTQLQARLDIANESASRSIWDQVEVVVEGPITLARVAL